MVSRGPGQHRTCSLELALLGVMTFGLGACGPRGLAPGVAAAYPGVLSGERRLTRQFRWPPQPKRYRFSPEEQQEMKALGCGFDPADERAGRMLRRGFTSQDILQACRDVLRIARGDSSQLEVLASYRRSGLSFASYAAFRRSGRTLTAWYNREVLGGARTFMGGWILLAAGGLSAAVAGITAAIWRIAQIVCRAKEALNESYHADNYTSPCERRLTPGSPYFPAVMTFLGVSAVSGMTGATLSIVGGVKRRRWLRGEVLDKGTVRDLERFRRRYVTQPEPSGLRVDLAPLIVRGGGGVGLTLRW